jgi:hypothetical protein
VEYWIQETLFDNAPLARPASPAVTSVTARAPGYPRRTDRSRVTRDPAVARSYAESAHTASDFRVGLARAFGRISDEERTALRARLGR